MALAVFLRGINLGNRRVTSAELVKPFEKAGLTGARTFIASGNVVVNTPAGRSPAEVEVLVEREMRAALGFEADAFARTLGELARVAGATELVSAEAEGYTPHVIFLKEPPTAAAVRALAAIETPDDRFPVLGREAIWLRRGNLTDSTLDSRDLERALGGVPNTMRKVTTLRRMVERFGG